jgi:acetyl-CoA acetyltransferase
MQEVCVVGAGFSVPERPARTGLDVHAATAIDQALADAGLTRSDIDGLATYPHAPFRGAGARDGIDVITVDHVARRPGFGDITWAAEANLGMITSSISEAAAALSTGLCTYALVWRAMSLPGHRYGQVDAVPPAAGDTQFSAPWNLISPVQWHALAYRRYLERYGLDPARLGALAVASRGWAKDNPHAYFRDRPLGTQDYLDSRLISDPLRLYDCDLPVQASIALVLTTADRARNTPWAARIAGTAMNIPSGPASLHYTVEDYLERGGRVAANLWRSAGLGPGELGAVQVYDGFAPSVVYWLEAAGFCWPGEAFDYLRDPRLPLNTFGGSLSAGRLHGLGHVAEAAQQVAGRAGARQLPDVGAVGVFVGSPMLDGGALVLTGFGSRR